MVTREKLEDLLWKVEKAKRNADQLGDVVPQIPIVKQQLESIQFDLQKILSREE